MGFLQATTISGEWHYNDTVSGCWQKDKKNKFQHQGLQMSLGDLLWADAITALIPTLWKGDGFPHKNPWDECDRRVSGFAYTRVDLSNYSRWILWPHVIHVKSYRTYFITEAFSHFGDINCICVDPMGSNFQPKQPQLGLHPRICFDSQPHLGIVPTKK